MIRCERCGSSCLYWVHRIAKKFQNSASSGWISFKILFAKAIWVTQAQVLRKNLNFMALWASWHVSLSIPENRTQNYSKLTSLQHFEINIPGNFQKLTFSFFSIFSKLCFLNKSILWHSGLLHMFLCRSPKTVLKNTPKLTSLQHYEVDILGNFKKWKFRFS